MSTTVASREPVSGAKKDNPPIYTRAEVATHKTSKDCWIIIHGEVYDVTGWLRKHPGGKLVLMHYAGEDATAAWTSFHNNQALSRKYMAAFHIGHVVQEERENSEIIQDFLNLRSDLEKKGMFRASPLFFVALFAHIFALHILGWWLLWRFGNTWLTWVASACLVMASQAQAGWLQHDFGHHTVFNSTKLNHFLHDITIGLMKGVSGYWWNYRHFQHHAKPNVYMKDPDITIPFVFLLGKRIPKIWGEKHWGKIPYHFQHRYFFFVFPPLLLPLYFHVEVIFYVIRDKRWKDLFWQLAFYLLFHLQFASLLGGFWGSFRWYFFVRLLESHWFVWCTQISHLPMHIDTDKRKDWVSMQLSGTRDIEQGWFNDWFTGHLNYQIEHHLFPTMPRHNFSKVQPQVMELCKKHSLTFEVKGLWEAFEDIVKSLRESGEVWLEAWNLNVDTKSK